LSVTMAMLAREPHDDLGRPLPTLNSDHVVVYSSNLQLSLGSGEGTRKFATEPILDPPLSPGPPLRGYAAAPLAVASPKQDRRLADARERDAQYQQMMQAILDRTRQQNQSQEQDEDRRVERMLKHIAHEQEFVEQLDEQLLLRERAKYRRQTQLYKEWNERVYETIQAQIDEQLASLRTEDLSTRRRQLMEEYIRVSTQKRYGLYRDIIIESEYDPLVAHQKLLKYKMSDQQDPLKLEINNADLGKAKRALGRATLSATMWDRLHSTPYGRFDRIAPTPSALNPNFSRVHFEHYNVSHDPETLQREFPRGKRVVFDGPQRATRSAPWEQ